ncbi:hypothetical protein [Cribrihabitans pelagius]|uniref:hypothetical protein n=1 Tax=Cribrihabitans pelagius TaxID=1765746 RepID=UPI003B5A3C73
MLVLLMAGVGWNSLPGWLLLHREYQISDAEFARSCYYPAWFSRVSRVKWLKNGEFPHA